MLMSVSISVSLPYIKQIPRSLSDTKVKVISNDSKEIINGSVPYIRYNIQKPLHWDL